MPQVLVQIDDRARIACSAQHAQCCSHTVERHVCFALSASSQLYIEFLYSETLSAANDDEYFMITYQCLGSYALCPVLSKLPYTHRKP